MTNEYAEGLRKRYPEKYGQYTVHILKAADEMFYRLRNISFPDACVRVTEIKNYKHPFLSPLNLDQH